MTVRGRSAYPELAMIPPFPAASPLLEFCPPLFAEFSERPNRRALLNHFCNVMSHLIVFREESGNPFQQLVLPLTQKSGSVMNAIYALASAHMEHQGVDHPEKSLYFHNRAIQSLGKLIENNGKVNRNEILAAIMLLVYYEVLVQRGQSNIVAVHLKGALTVMCANPDPTDTTGAFLERAFRFYDVIAALSNGTAPLSAAPGPGCLLPFPPLGAPAASPLSNVDTLLGMATTLWPIIHRLSDLLPIKRDYDLAVRFNDAQPRIDALRAEFESAASSVETALSQWQPHLPPNFVPDGDDLTLGIPAGQNTSNSSNDTTAPGITGNTEPAHPPMSSSERARLHSILHNALAYRHSAFVYLYRTVYSYPRSHHAVQSNAHEALVHCVATVAYAGPMGALLWPLFAAACEAVATEDRSLAERAFSAIRKRQGMMNIERAWEIVQEVWRRADWADVVAGLPDEGRGRNSMYNGNFEQEEAETDLWRQVSKDMGVNIVFG
ncbi:fungal-specific transcription factor domain-containing protein [Cercophora newfieldiana]|uniref:Fungal-specific transcription factor domain-containing protein n=1 Tax=Cercophora newfieldiana TaxID=92897 RepID=A0AA39XTL7_9PEZI|nr:fungal-specific transcription factor domain-containing protein [Cercophora newfieldiana]